MLATHLKAKCLAIHAFHAGEFGIVYKALLRKSFTQAYSETVAVKTLKGKDFMC